MKIIAIASGKGGVGKSTVTTQLASTLANNGYQVGVIDADIYGPCQYGLLSATETEMHASPDNKIIPGYSELHKIHYVAVNNLVPDSNDAPMLWRAPIATKLIKEFLSHVAWPQLDFLFIDLPPGTGDIQLTIAQLAKLDGAIIVTTPQKVAYSIASKAIAMFNKVNVKTLGIIENMSSYICQHCEQENKIFQPDTSPDGGALLAEKYHAKLLGRIPLDHSLISLSDEGKSINTLADDNPVKQSYLTITQNLLLSMMETAKQQDTTSKKYQLINNKTLEITDTNNAVKQLSAYELRLNCQCALCKDELTGKALINKNIISEQVIITNVQEVGNYGLRFTFSDGHGSGIYVFEAM